MALIARFARLFNADVHAVLDRIEEPETLVKQSVRDMQEELAKGEQRLQWLHGELTQLGKKAATGDGVLDELNQELDICFAAQEHDLARNLIRRKLAQEQHLRALAEQQDTISHEAAQLDARLLEQREQLAQMQQKVDLFCDQASPTGMAPEPTISADDVEVAFLKEQRLRSGS